MRKTVKRIIVVELLILAAVLLFVGCGDAPQQAQTPEPPPKPARFVVADGAGADFGNVYALTDTKTGLSYVVVEGYSDNHPVAVYPAASQSTDIKELVEAIKLNNAIHDAELGVLKEQLAVQKKILDKSPLIREQMGQTTVK
jgi:hypothetical protein